MVNREPKLVGVLEHTVSTDFAILGVYQEARFGWAESSLYVTSAPGALALACGTKYAAPSVRVEVWDGEPAPVDHEWEDFDEVPFEGMPGEGDLVIAGFDPASPEEPQLDVGWLGRARASVLARGRHVHGYGDDVVDGPEEWLIRLWPDPDRRDALAGRPRRLAGPAGPPRRTAWAEAFKQWDQAGWRILDSIDAAASIRRVLEWGAARPLSPEDIAERWAASGVSWASPVRELLGGRSRPHLDMLARMAGLPAIDSHGDMLSAMLNVGLLAVTQGADPGRLVPNPSPPAVWELTTEWPDEEWQRRKAEFGAYRYLEHDLHHLVGWAPDQRLVARPVDIAVRLSVSALDVIGGLEFLRDPERGFIVETPIGELDPSQPVVVRRQR